jgi:hypothetical protein
MRRSSSVHSAINFANSVYAAIIANAAANPEALLDNLNSNQGNSGDRH